MSTKRSNQRRRIEISGDQARVLKILADASEKDVGEFLSVLRAYEHPARVTVVDHMEASRDVYFLLKGSARVSVYAHSGRWVTYEVLKAGAMFGEMSAIDGEPRSASVVTEEASVVGIITRNDFKSLLASSQYFSERTLKLMVIQTRTLMARLFEYNAMDVRGRVYAELIRLSEAGSIQSITISDKDMASRVGTTRENVTRIYSTLRNKGIIEKSQSQISLLRPEALAELREEREFS